jgi:hypothetical protein
MEGKCRGLFMVSSWHSCGVAEVNRENTIRDLHEMNQECQPLLLNRL